MFAYIPLAFYAENRSFLEKIVKKIWASLAHAATVNATAADLTKIDGVSSFLHAGEAVFLSQKFPCKNAAMGLQYSIIIK